MFSWPHGSSDSVTVVGIIPYPSYEHMHEGHVRPMELVYSDNSDGVFVILLLSVVTFVLVEAYHLVDLVNSSVVENNFLPFFGRGLRT